MGRASHRLSRRCVGGIVLAAALTGCALAPPDRGPVPATPTDPVPTTAAPQAGPAAALLAESRAARADQDYARAETALERAVRIEPSNAALWLEYGDLKLALGEFDQALAFARRAANLAGTDQELRSAASRLIADANRERARAANAAAREAELH